MPGGKISKRHKRRKVCLALKQDMQDLLKCSDNYKHCESTVQNEENQLLKTTNIQLSPPLDPEASEIDFVSDSTSIESADQLSVCSGSISLSDSEVIFPETESLNKELGPEIQDWTIKYSVTHNATDALLRILKPLHPELPSNARKLLETPRNIPISVMDTGEFIWIPPDLKSCEWPGSNSAKRAIEKQLQPQGNWSTNAIEVKSIASTFEELIPKRTKYLLTSNVDTSDDECEETRPPKKRGRGIKHAEFELVLHTSENLNQTSAYESSGIPSPPILPMIIPSQVDNVPTTSIDPVVPRTPPALQHVPTTSRPKGYLFEEKVLRKLNQLSLDISELSADVRSLKQHLRQPHQPLNLPGIPKFPMKIVADVSSFTELLKNSKELYNSVVSYLAGEGGETLRNALSGF
ncbi:unnamed protein product [Allacma fusca]|uniref:Uncharacterized protein n=1 Tax=Allacma fusca TaxID=39272 RepID=A0A8J2PQZ2_9HEXA|nr:unnamed protein product [Allacma fusca]